MTKWQTKEQTKAWRTFLQHFSAGMGGKGRIYYIGGTDVLPQPLTPKEEEHLISFSMQRDAYVASLIFFVLLNVLIPLIRPIVPIEIKSSTPTPVFSNFFAM